MHITTAVARHAVTGRFASKRSKIGLFSGRKSDGVAIPRTPRRVESIRPVSVGERLAKVEGLRVKRMGSGKSSSIPTLREMAASVRRKARSIKLMS